MSTPGIGDPYWYEWFVGLKYVLRMLNPDSGISCVVFQHGEYNTIDDVVVEYDNGNKQLCYQVKHEISTSVSNSLTFGKMLETKDGKKSLFEALFLGWKDANSPGSHTIKPVLFTNRTIHNRRATRTDNGEKYSAYPVDKFVSLIQNEISGGQDLSTINERDSNLAHQWNELCNALRMANKDELISFFEVLSIEGNQQNLTELEQSLVESLSQTFECNIGVARELFGRLLVGLKTWTTTERHIQQVFLEDVYSVLGFEEDIDDSQHRLAAPYPFFESRQVFCEELDKKLLSTEKKVVFLSGDPGSGKTSTISYLQATTSRFLLRYHTFKPISPEQRFYNADPGMCTPENLWGTLLIQLRKKFHGILAYEGTIEKANVEDPCFGGVNLFNHLGGIHRLFHGNCQLVPSSIWREFFGCKPSDMSPYVWINEDGDRILYFERIASPYREAIQESYVRQPILFRWVCNASWLEKVLRDNKLELWKVVSSEDYPAQ